MKARLTTYFAGEPNRSIGEIVEGEEAITFCAAGFAVPIVEDEKRETATRKRASKEVRETK